MRRMNEQEDKYEVDSDWVMPQITDLVPDGGGLDQQGARARQHLFRHIGRWFAAVWHHAAPSGRGSETGWQLKVRNGTARTELQSGSRAKKLPSALAKGVEGLLAGESLDSVAIMTTRTAYRVLNADGELVFEIADVQMESGPPDGESMLHSWREVESSWGLPARRRI